MTAPLFDLEWEAAPRPALTEHQLGRARAVVDRALNASPFYQRKLRAAGLTSADEVDSLEALRRLPFTTKTELVADHEESPPFGSRLTESLERYSRIHQTSGTTGKPLRILDTEE